MNEAKIYEPKKQQSKIIMDPISLQVITLATRARGQTIVLTIGTYDLLHIGHLRYLTMAKQHGDVLFVGVDSDRITKILKGPTRPIIPENERLEMLGYQEVVDFVTVIDDLDEQNQWTGHLLKIVQPDVFIAEKSSYTPEQLKFIERYCEMVTVLPRQAEKTSTSKTVARMREEVAS